MTPLAEAVRPLERNGVPPLVEPAKRPAVRLVAETPQQTLDIQIFTSMDVVEPVWRALEANGDGSVYQRFDWCKLWLDAFSAEGVRPVILVGRYNGTPCILLPMHVKPAAAGLKLIQFIGGPHANIRVPLVSKRDVHRRAIDRWIEEGDFLSDITKALQTARLGDHISFGCMPQEFAQQRNPLLLAGGTPCSDVVVATALSPDFGKLALERRGKASLKKLRSKTRALEQGGALRFERAKTPEDANAALDLFFAQKKARFDRLKLFNRFDHAEDRGFLRTLAAHSAANGDGLLDLYTLSRGGTPAAVFAVGELDGVVSGAVNSMTDDPDIAARSPGEVMLHRLIERLCGDGHRYFDLGFGDARYKQAWMDSIPLYSIDRALTPRGRFVSALLKMQTRARDMVLGNPVVAQTARQARYFVKRALR
ncbi:MAG: GNAT family N-acetyltransferase [Devosiaceae bacterium]|nr:GNAT family N-acetyltransferase [Devosiaceae bacterium MH13]